MEQAKYEELLKKIKEISFKTSLIFSSSCTETSSLLYDRMDRMGVVHTNSLETVLKKFFGYDKFRPFQQGIIQNVLDGRDTLAILPTGAGKSLCYQLPSLLMDGMTVVISPLIALMQDQVSELVRLKIPSVFLNSTLEWEEYKDTVKKIKDGNIKLLYVSPEAFNTARIQELLHSPGVKVNCITIDEAHCISEWGHDFRPDYLEIASIRAQFPKAVCLALTATATKDVRKDIIKLLHMENPGVFVSTFNRPNIFLEVKRKTSGKEQVLSFILSHKGECGIVYCFSRKQVDELAMYLKSHKINVLNYHGGLTDNVREKHQDYFLKGKVDVMVCTLAFGMGVNKKDVRYVIHYDMPKSIEQYYQEIGRAGRDGKPSNALLLYSPSDVHKIRYFFNEAADKNKSERLLQGMLSFANKNACRREQLLTYFGENFVSGAIPDVKKDFCCDICSSSSMAKVDCTTESQKFLSCILRTHERYGSYYIADVLTGSKNEKIYERGHENLSTYGIGKEMTRAQWVSLSEELILEDYICRNEEYGTLYVTEAGREKLRNKEKIFLNFIYEKQQEKKKITDDSKSKTEAQEKYVRPVLKLPSDLNLEKRLKEYRKEQSLSNDVPPYVIFSDRSMYDIIEKKPKNMTELMRCYGIGDVKAQKFGREIINIVRS